MFGSLSFVAVRKEQHDAAGALPFGFGGNNELIDDRLRTVCEIAELRLPQTQHVGIVERVSIIESEHSSFREETVINANAILLFGQVHQGNIGFARLLIVQNRMARAERAPRTILA